MHQAQLGDRARIRYSRIPAEENGNEKGIRQKTVEFIVGSRELPAGVSTGVVGMVPGDHRQFTVQPHRKGERSRRHGAVRRISRDRLPSSCNLRVGRRLSFVHRRTGRRLDMTIVQVTRTSVFLSRSSLFKRPVEVDVSLLSLDSSSTTNQEKPQFDIGGEG
jgi:FKBP-type peptidyl-prolyl cis-trans isomerase 2